MLVNNNIFNNIKIHTQYSICEGAIKIDELAEYCKNNKIKAIGLCDSLNLCGALEFAEKISKVGTQPIIGTQINFKINNIIGKLPLFAKTIDIINLLPLVSLRCFFSTSQMNSQLLKRMMMISIIPFKIILQKTDKQKEKHKKKNGMKKKWKV